MLLLTKLAVLLVLGSIGFFQQSDCSLRCGKKAGICANNKCCSFYGYCDDSYEHCSVGCQPEFGRCNPRRVISTVGFYETFENRCGKQNDFNYCSKGLCCSVNSYCDNTTAHCDDGCQPLFGRCNSIPSCNLYGNENVFPTEPFIQHSLNSPEKNYWFALCDSEQIFDDVSQPLPNVTCHEDGSLPEINPKCVVNSIYKSSVRNSNDSPFHEDDVVVDGNLVTCRELDVSQILEIRIASAIYSIRDIRITTQKSRGNFTLEIFDRSKHNTTILFKKEFNDVINYGHSVVFFTNVTAVLADASHRIIRFTPHIKMRICEIEASFIKEQTAVNAKSDQTRTLIITCSFIIVLLFIAIVVIVTVLCLQSPRLKKENASAERQTITVRRQNSYSAPRRRLPSLPVPKFDCEPSDGIYEEINFYEYQNISMPNIQLADRKKLMTGYDDETILPRPPTSLIWNN